MPKSSFHAKMDRKDKMYGTTTVGARGQVVVPAEARKDLGLKPGDRLVVMGKFGKIIALMKADQIEDFVTMVLSHIGDREIKKRFQKQAEALLQMAAKQ